MKRIPIGCFCGLLLIGQLALAADTLSLAGSWRFRADPRDQGVGERWFMKRLEETVHLPGSMAENGKGDVVSAATKWTASIYDSSWFFDPRMAKYREPGNLKLPFWLTPAKHYTGAAWYQKDVVVPAGWAGDRVTLLLERPHSETRVWVDDQEVGMQYGFCTAQEFELSGRLSPGKHTLTLCIDNRIKDINVGQDSHSLTDQTQGNWNGVVGKMMLIGRASAWLDDVAVYPDLSHKLARIRVRVRSLRADGEGSLRFIARSFNTAVRITTKEVTVKYRLMNGVDSLVVELPMGERVLTWDEFDPSLYRLEVGLMGGSEGLTDKRTVEFGMREFRVNGRHFEINGRPVHLRGTVENCVFPLTGYAPMDVPSWERVFRIARSFGLNHMRFHSYCPPEAAFRAADRVGFYLQPEGPSWANHGSSLGDGKPVDKFIFDETDRMDKAYGNYASFCMLAYGNEPRGGHQVEYLTRFIQYWKAKDGRHVYTGASVANSWPLVPENEFMIKSGARGLNWAGLPESESDYHSVVERFNMPYVTHEMGQWCAYPDFSEIPKYTGVYKAKNFELFREGLQAQGMGEEARAFLMASGKLQGVCYKAEIEKSLRTKDEGGFQLLSLTDYPGQGTALVGVLNAFWDEKGYMKAAAFSRFCNATVPLVRMPKFVLTSDEVLEAGVEIYHYGKVPLRDVNVDWVLRDAARHVAGQGSLPMKVIPIGNCIPVGNIQVSMAGIKRATALNLEVRIRNTRYVNDWNCWVYPAVLGAGVDKEVYYCTDLNERARVVLEEGGKVFLNAAGKVVKGKEVVMNFTPVFWNTSWFKMRPPHTLGIVVDPGHPVFADFPTEAYSDLQWWDILNKAQVMHLEDFPAGFRPLVQPIDTWFLNRRLGLVFEARVGKGRLVVSSADLSPEPGRDRPAARQLYYSVHRYMLSAAFKPVYEVGFDAVKDLFVSGSHFVFSANTKSGPDELKVPAAAPIDRPALVGRHDVHLEKADALGSLSLGNGRFAVTVDVTGLQSFPQFYAKGVPLGTESEWGWHSFTDTSHFREEEAWKDFSVHGRKIPYSVQWKEPERARRAADWFRVNVHRLQLGNLAFELIRKDGSVAGIELIRDIHQVLHLWKGEISSSFTLEGVPVIVSTFVHPDQDVVAVSVRSKLMEEGRLSIRLRFPYPTGGFADAGDYFGQEDRHRSELVVDGEGGALIEHVLDSTRYFVGLRWSGKARCRKAAVHEFRLTPSVGDHFSFSCRYSAGRPPEAIPSYAATSVASVNSWNDFWMSGGAVDFSGSTDVRARELERRVILSQYLTRIQCAGDQPPQETGLTYNSWYGKPHLEMHWWHAAHFALWGRPELLERSLDWYGHVAGGARRIAERQGFEGIRWQKMTDPEGRESPSSVGAFLIWQQPHFIYFADLCYRQHPDAATLKKYEDLVFATADFMASYPWYDSVGHRYVLGNGLIPAQERFAADSTINPCFELAYWRWALSTAQRWRGLLGMAPEPSWRRVERELSLLPVGEGMYFPTESATDAYTNMRYRTDHPAVLGTYGFLPATAGLDTAIMHHTFDWIWTNWKWEDTWGWDFPLTAMCATRLGLPDQAIDALLMPVTKNTYLVNGHNYQDDRLRLYLPGNGGLLAAIAIMCAGYDGCTRVNPGIPKDGKWRVRWEGLKRMP